MRMNLQRRSLLIITLLLFLAVSINTGVLTYISYSRYKQAVISKATSIGSAMAKEIGKVLELGVTIDNIEGLNEKMKGLITDETIEYSMVFDKGGKILFHSHEEKIGETRSDILNANVSSLRGSIVQKSGAFFDILLPLLDARDENVGCLAVGVKSSVINKELYNLLIWAISTSMISFLFFAGIIQFSISRFLTGPILEMEKTARKFSSGDLTELIGKTGRDEIASLAEAMNNIALNLRDMLFKIKTLSTNVSAVTAHITNSPASVRRVVDLQKNAIEENAKHVAEMNSSISSIALSSESLRESAENASAAAEEMISSIGSIAENVNVFNMTSHESAASIEEMIASLKETARSIDILAASSEESSTALSQVNASIAEIQRGADESVRLAETVSMEAAEKGLASIRSATKGIEDIKDCVNSISEAIRRLEKRSEEIGSIVNIIDDVASQTGLLSLNAAILAAQAGQYGKCFAVIADEIKGLAEKTSMSTKEIDELISSVQAETRSSVDLTAEGIKSVERGIKLIEEVNNALVSVLESSQSSTSMSKSIQKATAEEANLILRITESIREMNNQIEQISDATREQNKGSALILEAAGKIRVGSEQIKHATEEQMKGSKQMKSVSENVSTQSEQITLAIRSQKQKSEEILKNMERIQKTTSELVESATEMERSISSLSENAETLLEEIQKFRIS
ncbi:MAG: methyl-accepting chemotaxis protein [Nitrospirota bacterium]